MQQPISPSEIQLVNSSASPRSRSQFTQVPNQPQPQQAQPQFPLKKNLPYILVGAAVLLLILLFIRDRPKPLPKVSSLPPVVPPDAFDFLVYCPYYYRDKIKPFINTVSGNSDLRKLQRSSYKFTLSSHSDIDQKNTYVVEMNTIPNNSASPLMYCGLATLFNSTCDEKVQELCSSPGPMFDLRVGQKTDIVWINSLNGDLVPSGMCDDDEHCTLMSKLSGSKTFIDPTTQDSSSISIKISPTNWPTTTHVHGAEVRPTFDGNPLSWINNNGSWGEGAFTSNDSCYYQSFDQTDSQNNKYLAPKIIVYNQFNQVVNRTKVNSYPNNQNPGNLWYHDHAMRLTQYNVKNGLAGNYILRNETIQEQIGVDKVNQKIVMMTREGWKASYNLTLSSEIVYRFRFLNNNYDGGSVFKIRITKGNCNQNIAIPFTIIGADSSLFNEGINATQFIIAQAERMEILILFTADISTYSICSDSSSSLHRDSASKFSFENNIVINSLQEKHKNANNRTSINNVTLDVPFVDFTNKTDLVAVKRMRPLIQLPGTKTINGRKSFHFVHSQNPTIGTYEDWYLINSMGSDHPIHIHLINYQVIKILSLRIVASCNLYELDFIVQAIVKGSSPIINDSSIFIDPKDKGIVNYTELCSQKETIYKSENFTKLLTLVNVQNQIDPNNISGINVEKQLTPYDRQLFKRLNIPIADDQNFKYVNNQQNFTQPYYRRWKDTALVKANKVFVYRIRWAKSAYVDGSNDAYFHVPLDQLRQYPGFVYHCHILAHEDNEMMRPIMLQLPKNAKLNSSTPCNQGTDYSWAKKVDCLNKKCVPTK